MHTIINPSRPDSRKGFAKPASAASFRKPNYDCRDQHDAVKLVVYVPGVDASGVEIEAAGPDLLVTAHKTRFVRVNWSSLHLESAQRDDRLRLRLGAGFDYPSMEAEIRYGVLTVTLPKRASGVQGVPADLERVA